MIPPTLPYASSERSWAFLSYAFILYTINLIISLYRVIYVLERRKTKWKDPKL